MDFRILGPLEVYDGDRRLALGGTKQRALLGVLLLQANQVVSIDRLTAELWGEEGLERGSKALQVAVSRLRRALEPELAAPQDSRFLLTRPHGYELRVPPGQLDLHRFEAGIASGRVALATGDAATAAQQLREALTLWRGPPLADLISEGFSQAEIARLDDLHASALENRITADLELGRHATLTGELERLVAEHPFRERLRHAQMLALYRSGRQADALEAYRDARRVLVDQLGIEPGRELKALERDMLAQDVALEPEPSLEAPAAAPATASATDGGFVGRERELSELLSALGAARAGSGSLILVGGEPGIGKSRLAEELTTRARETGSRVLVGRCWEAGGAPPYWPWVQALRSSMRETETVRLRSQVGLRGPELATIVPELHELLPGLPVAPATDTEGARFRLFDAVVTYLRNAATEPLVLFLDDLHAADEPSLLLLRFLAGELAGARILVVACYRDTEVGAHTALDETLLALDRDGSVRRISLRGLDRADTDRLLELTTGEAPPPELAARVHDETEGNPLFAGQIGQLLATEGHVDPATGTQGGLPIPIGVRAAIGRRLHGQSDSCRDVLTLAAVFGREFDLDALERVSDREQDDLYDALDEAAAARLVGEIPGAGGRLRFSHVLIRDVLYEDVPVTRRPRLHRRVGEALEALYAGNLGPHLAELAHHFLASGKGGVTKALEYTTRAGDLARSQLAYEEAARHYASALGLSETRGSGDSPQRCELLLSLADVLSRAGNEVEAKDAFRRAATLAQQSRQPDQLARAALGYGGRFIWGRAGSDQALVPLLEAALAAVGEADSPSRVRLLTRLAAALRDEPSRDRRRRLADEAVKTARRIGDPVTLAYALDGYWTAVEGPDNFDSRLGGVDELIALGEAIGDKERVYVGHDYRLHTFWMLGDRAGIEVELDTLSSLADELRQPAQEWHRGALLTELALMEGRFQRAEELIAETLARGQGAQSWNATVSQRLALFVLRREQGRLPELEETLRRSVHEYPALERFQCALAHLYAELGRERDARTVLDSLLSRDLSREYMDAEWLFGKSLLPDVCAFLSDADAAARLHALLLPYERRYAEAPVEATFGSMARGLGVLATTLRHFDDAERHFEVALEMERGMRALPWIAHVQHDFAAMLLARGGPGDPVRADALLTEAVGTYRALGMESWAARAVAAR